MLSTKAFLFRGLVWHSGGPILLFLATFLSGVLGPLQRQAFAAETVVSPLYAQYNTFLEMQNFLELTAGENSSAIVFVSIYSPDGTLRKAIPGFTLRALEQRDLDINAQIGGVNDTYGLIKVEFNSPTAQISGRVSFYKREADVDEYAFAFARELQAARTGTTYAIANSFDPQGRGYLVPVWAEIVNLDSTSRTFTHNTYNIGGTLVNSTAISLAPNERLDLAAGHQLGESVYLSEFIPNTPTAPYLATVTRYGLNSPFSDPNPIYAYAMPVDAQTGISDPLFAPLMNRRADCWEQVNWLEIVNVSSSNATISVDFRDDRGLLFETTSISLPAKSQFHYNGSGLLQTRNKTMGSAKVSSNVANSLFVESAVYYLDCADNTLQTAYVLPSSTGREAPFVGSYNRLLGMTDELLIFSTSGNTRTVEQELRVFGQDDPIFTGTISLRPFGVSLQDLEETAFNTTPDTYGTILLDAIRGANVILAHNIRVRVVNEGKTIDFAVPTAVK